MKKEPSLKYMYESAVKHKTFRIFVRNTKPELLLFQGTLIDVIPAHEFLDERLAQMYYGRKDSFVTKPRKIHRYAFRSKEGKYVVVDDDRCKFRIVEYSEFSKKRDDKHGKSRYKKDL